MNVLKNCIIGLIAILPTMTYANSHLGLYTNDLAKCMVSSLSANDKQIIQNTTLQGMFSHPSLNQKNPYSQYEINQTQQQFGRLVTRLFAKDCTKELMIATYYDNKAVERASETLGVYVMQDLINHPNYERYWLGIEHYMNKQELEHAIQDVLKD